MTNKRLKTGGREKGTPNKINAELKALISEVALSEFLYIQEHLGDLELIDRYRFAVAMSRLIIAPPTKELPYSDPPIIYIHQDL
jgi:hypothetical protein